MKAAEKPNYILVYTEKKFKIGKISEKINTSKLSKIPLLHQKEFYSRSDEEAKKLIKRINEKTKKTMCQDFENNSKTNGHKCILIKKETPKAIETIKKGKQPATEISLKIIDIIQLDGQKKKS